MLKPESKLFFIHVFASLVLEYCTLSQNIIFIFQFLDIPFYVQNTQLSDQKENLLAVKADKYRIQCIMMYRLSSLFLFFFVDLYNFLLKGVKFELSLA